MTTIKKLILSAIIAIICIGGADAREKTRINLGWKHQHGELPGAEAKVYDDSKWTTVNLPHDAAVYGEFKEKGEGRSARNGYRPLRRGWYRKQINYNEAWQGKRVILEFEGVYRDAKVYINGSLCEGKNPNGYMDFEFDITDKLKEGSNTIAVSYNNTYEKSSRWYNGEGINRDVWLHVVDPVHVDRYGTYITTPKIQGDRAKVVIETNVRNDRKDSILCRLVTDIVNPQGHIVASRVAVVPFAGGEVYKFHQELYLDSIQLWQVGEGKLYKAISNIYVAGSKEHPNDIYETTFGIREIEFTPEEGLLVNGKKVYINGFCLHTDLGPLGTASLEAAWDYRLQAIKDFGCNGIRLSHNCYPKYVLDWADRHGMLVYDEFFDKWEDSFYGRNAKMGELHIRDIKTQIARDRNHPSVFIWSVGNEVYQQIRNDWTRKDGVQMLKMLVDEVHKFEPSRKVTVAQYPNRYGGARKKDNARRFYAAEPHQFEYYSDIVSTNYLEEFWNRDRKKYPQLMFIASELSVGSLGYEYFHIDTSYAIGHFYWGGTDYIGESFGWPSKGWVRGLIDFTNRIKPLGQSVKSFLTAEPMVKIITRPDKGQGQLVWNDLKMTWIQMEEHWNYTGIDTMKVQVMSNCDETELLLNGESLGRKSLPEKGKHPEITWQVPYSKGELKAIGYKNGTKVAEDIIRTAGKPARLLVDVTKTALSADGHDLAYLNYTVVDKDGNVCATDDVSLEFTVTGAGTNAGVANGNMLSDEPWQGNRRTTYNGRAQLIVRASDVAGKIRVTAKAKGLKTVKTILRVDE